MQYQDRMGLFGNLTVVLRDHSEEHPVEVLRITKKNKITNQGRQNLLHLFAQPTYDIANKQLGQIILGTNPAAASITDTASTPIIAWTSGDLVYGPSGTIIVEDALYLIDITVTCGPGSALTNLCEAGVLTKDGNVLYARQTFPAVNKSPYMSITVNWQLGLMLQAE